MTHTRDKTFFGRHRRRADEPTDGSTQVLRVQPLDKFGNVGGGSGGGGGGGDSAVYQGSSVEEAGDFQVVRAAATQLTLSELPFPLVFENLVAIYEYDGDNLVASYDPADTTYDWTWAPLRTTPRARLP